MKPRKSERELLDAGADGDEVVVVADVEELLLDERFLEPEVMIEARVPLRDVGVDAAVFRQVDEVRR